MRAKNNAFQKFACSAACPGGTNDNSPAIHRWVWAGPGHKSRRDERRLIPASLINRGDSVVPTGLCAARPRTPALKRWAIVTKSLRDKALAEFPKGIKANDECQRNTEIRIERNGPGRANSGFEHSGFFRHSSFVIRFSMKGSLSHT